MILYAFHVLLQIPAERWLVLLLLSAVMVGIRSGYLCLEKAHLKHSGRRRARMGYAVTICTAFILWSTLFLRTPGTEHQANLSPLWSWHQGFLQGNDEIRWQIYFNILLFVPLGFFSQLSKARPLGRTILRGFLLSLFIEMCQYIFRLGLFEWDDMIHNTLGCVLGCLCAGGVERIWSKMRQTAREIRQSPSAERTSGRGGLHNNWL